MLVFKITVSLVCILNMSKIKCIVYRSDLNNLEIRKKEMKKYCRVGIKLSINCNTNGRIALNSENIRNMLCNLQKQFMQFTYQPK